MKPIRYRRCWTNDSADLLCQATVPSITRLPVPSETNRNALKNHWLLSQNDTVHQRYISGSDATRFSSIYRLFLSTSKIQSTSSDTQILSKEATSKQNISKLHRVRSSTYSNMAMLEPFPDFVDDGAFDVQTPPSRSAGQTESPSNSAEPFKESIETLLARSGEPRRRTRIPQKELASHDSPVGLDTKGSAESLPNLGEPLPTEPAVEKRISFLADFRARYGYDLVDEDGKKAAVERDGTGYDSEQEGERTPRGSKSETVFEESIEALLSRSDKPVRRRISVQGSKTAQDRPNSTTDVKGPPEIAVPPITIPIAKRTGFVADTWTQYGYDLIVEDCVKTAVERHESSDENYQEGEKILEGMNK